MFMVPSSDFTWDIEVFLTFVAVHGFIFFLWKEKCAKITCQTQHCLPLIFTVVHFKCVKWEKKWKGSLTNRTAVHCVMVKESSFPHPKIICKWPKVCGLCLLQETPHQGVGSASYLRPINSTFWPQSGLNLNTLCTKVNKVFHRTQTRQPNKSSPQCTKCNGCFEYEFLNFPRYGGFNFPEVPMGNKIDIVNGTLQ